MPDAFIIEKKRENENNIGEASFLWFQVGPVSRPAAAGPETVRAACITLLFRLLQLDWVTPVTRVHTFDDDTLCCGGVYAERNKIPQLFLKENEAEIEFIFFCTYTEMECEGISRVI